MLVMIDNYDSFTWNLVQYAAELGVEVQVHRNDQITCDELAELAPAAIMVSPGPGRPDTAGISLELIERFSGSIPILGVCLGHQSIGQQHGCDIVQAQRIMHGKLSDVYHNGTGVFEGLPNPLVATRYHSLVIKANSLPGVRHRTKCLEGVQFHPESISSEHGHAMLKRFFVEAGLL